MKISKIIVHALFFSSCFIGFNALADFTFLYVTNLNSGEKKEYRLGKKFDIPIKDVEGWKSCQAHEPKSKYIKETNSHIRQYFIHCNSDSGASVEILCALFDEKGSQDSSSITLISRQRTQQVLLFLNCLKR